MLFHTYTFAVFFTIVYTVFLLLRKTKYWVHWLLAASYVFYGWWNPLLPAAHSVFHYYRLRVGAADGERPAAEEVLVRARRDERSLPFAVLQVQRFHN